MGNKQKIIYHTLNVLARTYISPQNFEALWSMKYNLQATNNPNPSSLPSGHTNFLAPNANVYANANLKAEELEG